jgi:hypothetical protein
MQQKPIKKQKPLITLPVGKYEINNPILINSQVGYVIEGATGLAANDEIANLPSRNSDN